MLLLYLFFLLQQTGKCAQIAVFHLDHRLRKESHKDKAFIQELCCDLAVPFYHETKDILSYAKEWKKSIEEAGRCLRYELLAKETAKLGPAYGVTGHHADDYCESLLIHLLRGGGPQAMRSMPLWKRLYGTMIMRPLCCLSQSKITEIVKECQIPFCEDSSNQSTAFLRNRIRKRILPLLQQEGLQPVKLWHNFHPLVRKQDSPTWKRQMRRPDYLKLDRLLFASSQRQKRLWDICLEGLGAAPAQRAFLDEIAKQMTQGPDFRLHYNCSSFFLWSNRRGPIWLIAPHADLWQPYRIVSSSIAYGNKKRLEILYNHKKRIYLLEKGQEIQSFAPGMKAQLKDKGRKKLAKIFQEVGLPPPIRRNLPLVVQGDELYVQRICLSFWDTMQDRY